MVAAVKLRGSQNRLEVAREFSKDIEDVWKVESEDPEDLVVAISSDKGLCGGVNSAIQRLVRDDVMDGEQKIMLYGEKARPGLERLFADRFVLTLSDLGNNREVSFRNVGVLVDFWLAEKWNKSFLYYNYFKSMISYVTSKEEFASFEKSTEDLSQFYPYEVLENLYEFRIGCAFFHYLCENDTSTLSSRMNAMDNSSKNAGEMIESLTMQMNRARQAKITTELIEIISGAAAVEAG